MGGDLEDLPIEPGEAADLGLHVRNCIRRHIALVRHINRFQARLARSEMITWIYRAIIIPVLCWIGYEMWRLPERLHTLVGMQ